MWPTGSQMGRSFPSTLSAFGAVLAIRDGAGKPLTLAERETALEAVRAGKPTRLQLDAVTFVQRDTPNRNFVRFLPAILEPMAASFVGMPVLRDHEQGNLSARAGTITKSELGQHEGFPAFLQTLELVKPWAVEAALDGTLDRFSIGWHTTGDVLCSVCGEKMMSLDCAHFPGDEVKTDGGLKTSVVEMVFTGAQGVETSAVSVPAVEGTGIQDIRAALALLRTEPQEKKPMILAKLAAVLAMSADASEAAILAEVEGLKAERQLLAAEREGHKETKAALAAAEQKLAASAAAEHETRVSALIESAVRDGKIRPQLDAAGARVLSEREKAIALWAKTSFKAAEEYVADLPKLYPIGGQLQSGDPPEEKPALELISPEQKAVNKALGISDEVFLKHRPQLKSA